MYQNELKGWRKTIRIKGYDYSRPGMYFVTICTGNRSCCFGDVVVCDDNGIGVRAGLSEAGKKVEEIWLSIPDHHRSVGLDEFVIMPNHLHGILKIEEQEFSGRRGVARYAPTNAGIARNAATTGNIARNAATTGNIARNAATARSFIKQPSGSLPTVVASFKSAASNAIRRIKGWENFQWQRNYYERIIRNERELEKIRRYIHENPISWFEDIENPKIISRITEHEIKNYYERQCRFDI